MKISELNTERAADILCEISVFALNIFSDEEITAAFRKKAESSGASTNAEMIAVGVEKIGQLAPLLLKKHREDVFGILAVLNDTSAEKIAKQNILKTMMQIREIAKDKDLIDFFRSSAQEETK